MEIERKEEQVELLNGDILDVDFYAELTYGDWEETEEGDKYQELEDVFFHEFRLYDCDDDSFVPTEEQITEAKEIIEAEIYACEDYNTIWD